MNPKKSDKVKVFIKPNIQINGVVESWTKKKIVLKTTMEVVVIPNPSDILYYTILQTLQKPIEDLSIEERIKIDTKKLVDLRLEESKLDRESISNNLRDLTFKDIGDSSYGVPNISKIKVPK